MLRAETIMAARVCSRSLRVFITLLMFRGLRLVAGLLSSTMYGRTVSVLVTVICPCRLHDSLRTGCLVRLLTDNIVSVLVICLCILRLVRFRPSGLNEML